MPLSLTPKRAAKLLIIVDEPAAVSVRKAPLAQTHDWNNAPHAIKSFGNVKVRLGFNRRSHEPIARKGRAAAIA